MAERTIADIGRFFQAKGLRIGEHPEFGGVGGGHTPGSFHYQPGGQAIDVTDWRPDVAPAFPGGKPIPWKQRTGELAWRAKQLGVFEEALGPGDKGHDTHVHLALPGKKFITDQQLEWLATGRYKDPTTGKLTDVKPMLNQQSPQIQPVQQPPKVDLPQAINIVVQTGGEDEDDQPITAQQQLKKYVESVFGEKKSNIPIGSLAKMIAAPTTNYFA
jgi:hypothetical protein